MTWDVQLWSALSGQTPETFSRWCWIRNVTDREGVRIWSEAFRMEPTHTLPEQAQHIWEFEDWWREH